MPDVILTERDQHLLRTLMDYEPVPWVADPRATACWS